jgi:hypothetical protein
MAIAIFHLIFLSRMRLLVYTERSSEGMMPLVPGWLEYPESTLSHRKSLGNPTNIEPTNIEMTPRVPGPFALKIAHKLKIARNMTLEKYLTQYSTSSVLLILLLFVSLLAFIAIMAAA